jgi:hypothetical protein
VCIAAAATVLAVAASSAPADVAPRLPDLDQVAPYLVSSVAVHRGKRTRFQLTFGSASQNVGAGPLIVVGHRASTAGALMTADQVIDTAESADGALGPQQTIPGVGVLRYTRSPDHSHWHFLAYMRYELRRASDFRRVGSDHKTGFCLGDRYSVGVFGLHARALRAQAAVGPGDFSDQCDRGRPNSLSLTEGISPGKGDDYKPRLEGQSIDITALPGGRYFLVHRTNVDRRIRESRYDNNVASALLQIARGRTRSGAFGPPTVRVLRSCSKTDRCR